MDNLFLKDIEAVLISSPHNLLYYTGFSGGEGYAVISPRKKLLYVDGRYTIQAKNQATDFQVIEYSGNVFCEIKKLGYKKIGFEDGFLTYKLYNKITNEGFELYGVSDTLEQNRCIKTKEEIENIKVAQSIGEEAYLHILDYIKPGVTEKELACEIDYFMRKNGGEGNSFDTIVAFGERAALPHAFPTDRKLNNNEFVLMDFGCIYNGYCGDMTRTVHMGKASSREKEIYNLVLEAQLKSLEVIKENITAIEVDKAARDVFKAAGYDKNFNHSLGHGVGVLIHELPNISPKSTAVLKENMVFSVEPGLYFENQFGVRIEDLVVVTNNGYLNLNCTNKQLVEL